MWPEELKKGKLPLQRCLRFKTACHVLNKSLHHCAIVHSTIHNMLSMHKIYCILKNFFFQSRWMDWTLGSELKHLEICVLAIPDA